MSETENKLKLYTKIANIQEKVQYIQKKGYNNMQKYSYVRESDVVAEIKAAALAEKVLLLFTFMEETTNAVFDLKQNKVTQERVVCQLRMIDLETGYSEVSSFPGTGSDYGSGDKAIYKAITGAVKYALKNTFLVETGDEADPENETDGETQEVKQAQPTKQQERLNEIEVKIQEAPDQVKQLVIDLQMARKVFVGICYAHEWNWVKIELDLREKLIQREAKQ